VPTTGAPHNLPFPALTDPPNGPAQLQALAAQIAARLGYTGKSIIAGEESRTNGAYGLMPTPDRVQGVVLPTDGVLMILFQAAWKEEITMDARAALFIGSNQLKRATNAASPVVMETPHGIANTYRPLVSDPRYGVTVLASGTAYTGDVTTGQLVGGLSPYNFDTGGADDVSAGGAVFVFAAAGTYDVSVQFKAGGGVTVKNRKLWVRALAF
jgi:hypothetical protein